MIFVTNYEEEFSYVASFDLNKQEFKPICKIEKEDISDIKWHAETKMATLFRRKVLQIGYINLYGIKRVNSIEFSGRYDKSN